MGKIPLLALLLQGLPECIGIVFLSTKLLGYQYTDYSKKLLLIGFGILQACLAYIIRILPFVFGIHTVVLTITISLCTCLITKKPLPLSLIASATSLTLLIIFEDLFYFLIVNVLAIDPEIIMSNIWLRIAVGWPQIILLFIATLISGRIYKYIRNKKPVAI